MEKPAIAAPAPPGAPQPQTIRLPVYMPEISAHPILQQSWDYLSEVCHRCDRHTFYGRYLGCSVLGRPLMGDILTSLAFCPIGKHGDPPHAGLIRRLTYYQRAILRPGRLALAFYAGGAIKRFFTWIGACRTPEKIILDRRRICMGSETEPPCDRFDGKNRCNECGCPIAAKTKLSYEKCPLDKWDVVKSGRGCGILSYLHSTGLFDRGLMYVKYRREKAARLRGKLKQEFHGAPMPPLVKAPCAECGKKEQEPIPSVIFPHTAAWGRNERPFAVHPERNAINKDKIRKVIAGMAAAWKPPKAENGPSAQSPGNGQSSAEPPVQGDG